VCMGSWDGGPGGPEKRQGREAMDEAGLGAGQGVLEPG
jgi:hypothetical protein